MDLPGGELKNASRGPEPACVFDNPVLKGKLLGSIVLEGRGGGRDRGGMETTRYRFVVPTEFRPFNVSTVNVSTDR